MEMSANAGITGLPMLRTFRPLWSAFCHQQGRETEGHGVRRLKIPKDGTPRISAELERVILCDSMTLNSPAKLPPR